MRDRGTFTPAYPVFPPHPFDQVPTHESGIIGPRFFPNLEPDPSKPPMIPLVQDPLGQALAVLCDWQCEAVNGPEPVFDTTLGKQLDALRCDYAYTYPATHPERIDWQESVRHVGPLDLFALLPLGGSLLFEVARLEVPESGVLRIEAIDTWARFTTPGNPPTVAELTGMPSGSTVQQQSPFPLSPLVVAGLSVRLTWSLVQSRYGWISPDPLWVTAAPPPAQVPLSAVRSDWSDNRYGWGSPYSRRAHYQMGGHGLARLFVRLEVVGAPPTGSTAELAGSLQGFRQQAGRDHAATRNATLRLV
jgi:hypothetical protein